MKIAMVSTWKAKCGVGEYCERLCNALSKDVELKIISEMTSKELPSINPEIVIPYVRCYIRGGAYDGTLKNILEFNPDLVHIQFESSMYQESYNPNGLYMQFLDSLHQNGFKTVMTFHNIIPKPNWFNDEIKQITNWYNGLGSKIICGNEATTQEFLKWSPKGDATTILLGSTIFDFIPRSEAISKLMLDKDNIYIVQPGFFGGDKGMVRLVKAMPEILKKYPQAKLVFAGGLHPFAPEAWKIHTRDCIKEILKLKLTDSILPLGRFVDETELNLWLGAANIVMLNYHWVSGLYSTSASSHRVLCANRPIIMNSEDVRLTEYIDGINCCKTDDTHLVDSIFKCLEDKSYAEKISAGALAYAHETTFEKIADKHLLIYKELLK